MAGWHHRHDGYKVANSEMEKDGEPGVLQSVELQSRARLRDWTPPTLSSPSPLLGFTALLSLYAGGSDALRSLVHKQKSRFSIYSQNITEIHRQRESFFSSLPMSTLKSWNIFSKFL